MADTNNQDSDKQKTYDLAKLTFSYFRSLLFVDSDEFLYCSKPFKQIELSWDRSRRISHQSFYQLSLFERKSNVEELKFVRRVYSGQFTLLDDSKSKDLTNLTHSCMQEIYQRNREDISNPSTPTHAQMISNFLSQIFSCWSGAAWNNNPGKSSDLAGVCPFHWNHLSCVHWKQKGSASWQNRQRFFFLLPESHVSYHSRCFCNVGVPDEYSSTPLSLNSIRGYFHKNAEDYPTLYEPE